MIGSMCGKDSIERDSIVMLDMAVDVTAKGQTRARVGLSRGDVGK
jgi:hypothetical protein